MLLCDSDFEVVSSPNLKSYDMGVKSPAVIFDILCNRTYRYPLRTMIQEYMSNARDAHRELGKENVPIEVTLPNVLEPNMQIRDFGPGISPQRMQDVFIYLGASTKRTSNDEHGGFGIGAKIAFAYTDSFGITTYIDGVVREYTAYKGSDGIGHIDQIAEYQKDEPNGTSISIAIKDNDIFEAQYSALKSSYFWPVRPIFMGTTSSTFEQLQDFEPRLGHTYTSCSTKELDFIGCFYPEATESRVHAVIDGIIYGPISTADVDTKHLVPGIFLFFDVGEVDVSVSREGLQYNEKTIRSIQSKLDKIVSDTTQTVSKVLLDACFKSDTLRELVYNLEEDLELYDWTTRIDRRFRFTTVRGDQYDMVLSVRRKSDYRIYLNLEDHNPGGPVKLFSLGYAGLETLSGKANWIDLHKYKHCLLNDRTSKLPTTTFFNRADEHVRANRKMLLAPAHKGHKGLVYVDANAHDERIRRIAADLGWLYTSQFEKKKKKVLSNKAKKQTTAAITHKDIVSTYFLTSSSRPYYSDGRQFVDACAKDNTVYVVPKRHVHRREQIALWKYMAEWPQVWQPRIVVLVTRTINIANQLIEHGNGKVLLYDAAAHRRMQNICNNVDYMILCAYLEMNSLHVKMEQFIPDRHLPTHSTSSLSKLDAQLPRLGGVFGVLGDIADKSRSIRDNDVFGSRRYALPSAPDCLSKLSHRYRVSKWPDAEIKGGPALVSRIKKLAHKIFGMFELAADHYLEKYYPLVYQVSRYQRIPDDDTWDDIAEYIHYKKNKNLGG